MFSDYDISKRDTKELECSTNPNIRCYIRLPRQIYVIYYTDNGEAIGQVSTQLDDIFVDIDPDYRGIGIGTLLLEHFLSVENKRPLRLSTLETNIPMRRLAEKVGFVAVGRRPGASMYQDGMELIYQLE